MGSWHYLMASFGLPELKGMSEVCNAEERGV